MPEAIDAREQVVQAVAEFVEQRDHVVVGEQRGFAPDRRGEVAHQKGDRRLHDTACEPARDRLVHPGAAALGFTRIRVEVEAAQG